MIENISLLREAKRVYEQVLRSRSSGVSATLTLEEWAKVLRRFDGMCAYCMEHPFEAMDHLIPADCGGGTEAGNCLPACNSCNSRKSNRLLCEANPSISLEKKLEQVRHALSNGTCRRKSSKKEEELLPHGMYSVSQFAQLLGKSIKTLQRWDKAGILKAYRTPTNQRYYTHSQYLEYQRKGAQSHDAAGEKDQA